MKKTIKLIGIVALVLMIVCSLTGCPDTNGGQKSSDAKLTGITVNDVTATLGTPQAVLGSGITAGTVVLEDGAEDWTVEVVPSNSKAALKIVKFASNNTTYVADFAGTAAYNGEEISDGDFFIFGVTAEDGSKLYYRVNVTVASFLYELTAANVEGETNFNNVSFFISEYYLEDEYYTNMTYADISALFEEAPVTTINNTYEDMYIYAFEFTGAKSGTLVKAYTNGGMYLWGDESDEGLVIELVDASIATTVHTFTAANVEGEETFNNVAFFIIPSLPSEDIKSYSNYTWEFLITGLEVNPVTAIYDYHEGMYLFAAEFTQAKGGTLKKVGFVEAELTGTAADANIIVSLNNAEEPPAPPSAAINNSPIIVEATAANILGQGGEDADVDFIINLTNATVAEDFTVYAEDGHVFIEDEDQIYNLYYRFTGTGGNDFISVRISNTPEEESTATATITIPSYYLLDENGSPCLQDVAVDGVIQYAIDKAADPVFEDITDFALDFEGPFHINHTSTAAFKGIGTFGIIEGGSGLGITFSFVDGEGSTDNSLFTIDSRYGEFFIGDNALTEVKEYSVRIQVEDNAGKTFTKVFTFEVLEEIPALSGFTFNQDENMVMGNVPSDSDYYGIDSGSVIGTFTADDGTSLFTYSLVAGEGDTDNEMFGVYNYGEWVLQVESVPTEKREYTIRVQITDSATPPASVEEIVKFNLGYVSAEDIEVDLNHGNPVEISATVANDEGNGASSAMQSIYVSFITPAPDYITTGYIEGPIIANTDVSHFFDERVRNIGLDYTLTYDVSEYNGTSLDIFVSGTPTEEFTADDVYITIPAEYLLDANRNPSITDGLVIGPISYNITKAP
jgi:hypothetical protein